MTVGTVVRLGVLACGLWQFGSCTQEDSGTVEEGAVIEVDVIEVDESELGYADMKYTRGGQPFSGRAVKHYDDGSMAQRFSLVDGLYDGVAEEWYENGNKKVETHYKTGKRHGDNTYWYEDGRVMKTQFWQDDQLIRDEEH
jgi:hypothetical protein